MTRRKPIRRPSRRPARRPTRKPVRRPAPRSARGPARAARPARKPAAALKVPTSLLVIGHGSRVPGANHVLDQVVAALRREFRGLVVEACFLDIAQPDVQTGLDRCVTQGARRVLFVPYFLYLGGHVGRDLPDHIIQGRDRHPGLEIRIAPHLGFDRRLVAVATDRIRYGLKAGGWNS